MDDGPLDRAILSELIEAHGNCEAVAVETALEAESHLRRGGIDAILVDHNLGRDSGVSLVARWRGWGLTIPMILITSAPTPELQRRADLAGATTMVAKGSVPPEELLDLVRAISAV